MTTAVTKTKDQKLEIAAQLTGRLEGIRDVLPAGYSIARFKAVALNCISKNAALLDCDRTKLLLAFLQIAEMGLEPTGGQASIIPYGKDPKVVVEYPGKVKLAYNSGMVRSIYAKVVRKGDHYKVRYGTNPGIEHEERSSYGDELVAVYAVADLTTGGTVFAACDAKLVKRHQDCGRAKGGPWQEWTEAMWQKTAIHELYKVLPRSYQMQVSQEADDDLLTVDAVTPIRPWQGGAVLHSDSALPGLLSDLAEVSRDTIPTWTEQHVADIESLSDADRKALSDAIDARLKEVTP